MNDAAFNTETPQLKDYFFPFASAAARLAAKAASAFFALSPAGLGLGIALTLLPLLPAHTSTDMKCDKAQANNI